jgi:hypothetical protein
MIPEPVKNTLTSFTVGIFTNLATDILKSCVKDFENTLVGRIFKWAGIIEPNIYDHLYSILWKTLNLYFNKYPERDLSDLDSFFLDSRVASQIGNYILERKEIDWKEVKEAFEQQVLTEITVKQLQKQGLDSERILRDFIDCYSQVLREQQSLPQAVILFEVLEQQDNVIAEIRESEERLKQFINGLSQGQLSVQSRNSAYRLGQQALAVSLSDELVHVGLIDPNRSRQAIEARLQPVPALFTVGLCKGRLLKASPNQYFVSHNFTPTLLADWRQTLTEALTHTIGSSESLEPYFSGDTLLGGFRLCGICEKLYSSRFSMFLLPPSQDRNVYLELGIAIALGAPFFLIQHYEAQVPDILEGLSRYVKGGLFRTMRRELAEQIEEYDFGVVHYVANLPQAGICSRYLIAGGEQIEDEDFEGSIRDALERQYPDLEAVSLGNSLRAGNSGWALNQLVESIQVSRFAIYRVDEECSPSTFLALGISIGLNRPFLMVNRANREVPLDLRGMGMYQFSNFIALKQEIIPRHQEFFIQNAV